jgi:hypothetical protein
MKRLWAGLFVTTALVACDEGEPAEAEIYRACQVEWRGTLATGSSAFNIRTCWNGACSSNISVHAVGNDAGVATAVPDAGCTPTTAGGLPSRCPDVPIVPGPGCTFGELGGDFAITACARAGLGLTHFDIVLAATREGYPGGGDRVQLTIETPAGGALVEATTNLGSNGAATGRTTCQSGLFGLDGTPTD